jgi:glutathione S-transferase
MSRKKSIPPAAMSTEAFEVADFANLLLSLGSGGSAHSRNEGLRRHGDPRSTVAIAHDNSWDDLASHLPKDGANEKPVLTLYRDKNGWCPFCERLLLSLKRKQIPHEDVLIDLYNKPQWYKDMIPTALVPAMKIHDSGDIIYESLDMMKYLDEHFPETEALLQPEGVVSAALERNDAVMSAGFRFVYGSRNASLSEAEKSEYRTKFMEAMNELDASLSAGGPFLAGSRMTGADICLIPMLERYRYQLPLQSGVQVYTDDWPGIKRWFDAMDADPAYSETVAGDEISWTLVVPAFLRIFARNSDGGIDPETEKIIEKAESSANVLLEQVADLSHTAMVPGQGGALAAARKLIANHEAIVADACAGDTEPKSQGNLQRLPPSASSVVDHVLRNAAARLLGLDPVPVSKESASEAAHGARFIATRVCAPRDMGAPAAAAFRRALLQEAAEARVTSEASAMQFSR